MNENDMVDELRRAIERSDPSWVNQPSHLRRRLEEELGADARPRRAQIHLLIVGAEERLPARLRRSGWTSVERNRLVELLVTTRGWTPTASHWVVATWAGALGLTDDVPPPLMVGDASEGAPDVEPSIEAPSTPDGTATPATPSAATIVPDQAAPRDTPGVTIIGSEAAGEPATTPEPAPNGPIERSDAADQPPAALADRTDARPTDTPTPSAELPARSTGPLTSRASDFISDEVDVAYEVKIGPSPAYMFALMIVVGLGAFVVVRSVIPFAVAMLVLVAVPRLWPRRILAVHNERVWLLRSRTFAVTPTAEIATGTRADIEFAGGWPVPSVRFAGERLWFLAPVRAAARLLPAPSVDSNGTDGDTDAVRATTADGGRRAIQVTALLLVFCAAAVGIAILRGRTADAFEPGDCVRFVADGPATRGPGNVFTFSGEYVAEDCDSEAARYRLLRRAESSSACSRDEEYTIVRTGHEAYCSERLNDDDADEGS